LKNFTGFAVYLIMRSLKINSSVLLLFIIFFSCKQSPVAESLSMSDKLVIHFLEQEKVVKTVITEDKAAIKKMVYALGKGDVKQTSCEVNGKMIFLEDKAAIKKMVYALGKGDVKQTSCEVNGKMIFLKDNVELQQVNFSSTPGCRYFSYRFEGKQSFSSMTNEIANFLQSVKLGLDFY